MKTNKIKYINNSKPFLRWAGGKTWLLKEIDQYLPEKYNAYHEPFLGGGALFFYLQPYQSYLSDLNSELVDTYAAIKEDPYKVVEHLVKYENTEEFYYYMRNKKPRNRITKAARFIYLNKTSFNGIYRENLKGEYNVPYGRKKNYGIELETFVNASKMLQNASLKCQDFYSSLDTIQKNDLVFLDPPYTVTHNHNGFVKYNSSIFDEKSQLRLAKFIDDLDEIGAFYILTNAAHSWVFNAFKRKTNTIYELSRFSRVGGTNAVRGNYGEYLITNI